MRRRPPQSSGALEFARIARARSCILVVLGTRPEVIKLAPVLWALRAFAHLQPELCVTRQQSELLDEALAEFDLVPDHVLIAPPEGSSLSSQTSHMLHEVSRCIARFDPNTVVVQGDTTSAFVGGLAGFQSRRRVAHVEAGLRTATLAAPYPEEGYRRLLGQIAGVHYAPSASARANLLREGLPRDAVVLTGNTGIDSLEWLARRVTGYVAAPDRAGRELDLLVTMHRRESFGDGLMCVAEAVRDLVERLPELRVTWPLHPNPEVRSAVVRTLGHPCPHPRISLLAPLSYPAFIARLADSHLVLTDSGGVQEEAPHFGVPVFVLNDETARREPVAAGTAEVVGTDRTAIVEAVMAVLGDHQRYARMARVHRPYGDGQAGRRIAADLALRVDVPVEAA